MTENLNKKICKVFPTDGLVVDTQPAARTVAAVIRKLEKEGTVERGTVLAKSSKDGTLVPIGTPAEEGETLEPYGILADTITVGITENEPCIIYAEGKFNSNKIITANKYALSESDKDTLRKYGIEFTAALAY